jgi:hypothetical protein
MTAAGKGGIMAALAQISQEEVDQRVAVLRRFRTLLSEQRNRFRTYLAELDKQKDLIESGTAEELIAHVELEEKIVADIFAIHKVIDPLDEMYHAVSSSALSGGAEVQGLKSALDGLKKEAVVRSSRNKDLLSRRMTEIREEMKALRANPYLSGGGYGGKRSAFAPAPVLVDITG